MTPSGNQRVATIHRMVMPEHMCPYGLKSIHLLKRQGYIVDERWLRSREQTDAFKAEHGVATTPQTFIDGERVGGYQDLRRHFGYRVGGKDELTYAPAIALFSVAALMAMAASWARFGSPWTVAAGEWFIAFSMCLLALMKLRDVEQFSTMFLNYDLLAKRWLPYAYVYPYAELLAGVLMVAGALIWLSVPVALFIGTVGAVSVFKAVYIDRRELKCACVGGDTKPGFFMNPLLRPPMPRQGAVCSLWPARRSVRYAFAVHRSAARTLTRLRRPRNEDSRKVRARFRWASSR